MDSVEQFVSVPPLFNAPPQLTDFGDECFTPTSVWDDLLPILPRDRPLVDPFNGERFVEWGKLRGLDARSGDDFWGTQLPPRAVVVSNPPYSLKEEVCLELAAQGVPFVLVLPFGILRMSVMSALIDFKLVLWGENQLFTKADGTEVASRQLALIWGMEAPPLTWIPRRQLEYPPRRYMCRCGCSVKSRSRSRHNRTFYHQKHVADRVGQRPRGFSGP